MLLLRKWYTALTCGFAASVPSLPTEELSIFEFQSIIESDFMKSLIIIKHDMPRSFLLDYVPSKNVQDELWFILAELSVIFPYCQGFNLVALFLYRLYLNKNTTLVVVRDIFTKMKWSDDLRRVQAQAIIMQKILFRHSPILSAKLCLLYPSMEEGLIYPLVESFFITLGLECVQLEVGIKILEHILSNGSIYDVVYSLFRMVEQDVIGWTEEYFRKKDVNWTNFLIGHC